MVERVKPVLPMCQQCRLLAGSRAAVYREAAAVSAEYLAIMALIDRQYLARPYYGSRRECRHGLRPRLISSIANGSQRLMRLLGLVAISQRAHEQSGRRTKSIRTCSVGS